MSRNSYKLPKHKLQQAVPTRWNVQRIMLESLLQQKDAVTLALADDKDVKLLNAQRWNTARELINML
jgi:hypothetical protein